MFKKTKNVFTKKIIDSMGWPYTRSTWFLLYDEGARLQADKPSIKGTVLQFIFFLKCGYHGAIDI